MRRSTVAFVVVVCVFLLPFAVALDRQPNADYRARREALARKTEGGIIVIFAPMEAEGPNDLYGFRQDNQFFYLSGWSEPGAALLIAPPAQATPSPSARAYTEILFLPAHNPSQERWTGPKLGPENPDAPKITGFDRVEVIDRLRDELVRLLPQPRATLYSDLPAFGGGARARAPVPGHALRGGRAAHRHPAVWRGRHGHGAGRRDGHGGHAARLPRYQLRLPGEESREEQRRVGLPQGPGAGGAHAPGGAECHGNA